MNFLCGGASVGGGDCKTLWRLLLGFRLFPRGRGARRLALRQLDAKSRSATLIARNGNGSMVIADHRLDDGEAETCALHFRRVIRREEPGALFLRESLPRIRNVDSNEPFVLR